VLTLQAQHAERSAATLARQSRIQAVVGDTSLDEQIAVVSEQVESADALVSAMRAASDAAVTLRTTVDRLDRLVADSVFATVQEVRDAVRSPADIASAEALNRTHTTERAVVEKMLADPALHRAAQTPAPDIEQLVRTTDARVGRAAAANARADRLEEAAVRLESLIGDVHGQLARWQPLRGRRDLTEQVAQLVAGTAKDNLSKIRLSHYVLAARLAQVVAAANVRLRGICAGRYELEHTLQRGVGDARGGLGLRVMDTYTGRLRDPATLSGGETFYVSLALALGLADLVNNEIGGTELSTLFVDEGFGSLDADTLDEVVGELDALRSGGRSVGLVSHLAELRMRVPTQLSVVRSRKGSRLDDS
jgi:exonuclease SbcC